MAHYVFLDEDNMVVTAIVGVDEDDTSTLPEEFDSWEDFYADQKGMPCKRTSYNTIEGEHQDGKTPFRANYGGIGMFYDPVNDIFHNPQPYDSWTLNTTTGLWEAPIDYPNDETTSYYWDEEAYEGDTADPKTLGWTEIETE
tara:strand:+ start:1312 stop:1737 length:426 start_codon:yes stop_codon:yes gene_type:complete